MKRGILATFLILLLGILSFYFDKRIMEIIIKNNSLDLIFIFFSSVNFLVIVFISIILFSLKNRNKLFLFLFLIFSSYLISNILKIIIMRPRPINNLNQTFELLNLVTGYSFPSFHAFLLFALIPFVLMYSKNIKYSYLIATFFIVLSRIYLGYHYTSDIIFGGLIGYLYGKSIIDLEERKKIFQKFYEYHINRLKKPFIK